MKYDGLLEEELKNRIGEDYFDAFDYKMQIANIDFCVTLKSKRDSSPLMKPRPLLWAEAKKSASSLNHSLTQLVLTIGKARQSQKLRDQKSPSYLGAFDNEKISFIPYHKLNEIFSLPDFDWTIRPSDHGTKEFHQISTIIQRAHTAEQYLFYFGKNDDKLKQFIKTNFKEDKDNPEPIQVDRDNFVYVYEEWRELVMPQIKIDWGLAKTNGVLDGEFFLADLLSENNQTIKELEVQLRGDRYESNKELTPQGSLNMNLNYFRDGQKAHNQFWKDYKRPPAQEFWDYIVERRDLLTPQDIREREGSYYTPRRWVGSSRKYLTAALGKNWQDEYTIWDCAAGAGNLLVGMTEKYNIWASTVRPAEVKTMLDRIDNGANLVKNQVFQFDFLNGDFNDLPPKLKSIIDDPEKRKKLLIYINPPHGEATNAATIAGTGENRVGMTTIYKANEQFKEKIGKASNELFTLFLAQIHEKIPDCKLALFAPLKFVQGANFRKFRSYFSAEYLNGFVVPANTFDNVKGKFPIGFTVWDLDSKETIEQIECDVFDRNGLELGQKSFYGNLPNTINEWVKTFDSTGQQIGLVVSCAPDFQHNQQLAILSKQQERYCFDVTANNLIQFAVYFAVRQAISSTWLNWADPFLTPNHKWQSDAEFQRDCLAYTLFHDKNQIKSADGTNHWIPFTESDVNAKEKFASNFMTDFIGGKLKPAADKKMFGNAEVSSAPLVFSDEAKAVFTAGRALWQYYHAQPDSNADASLYDIREHFQGRNEKGKMNTKSTDSEYTKLIGALRAARNALAEKITPKIYEYKFLKQ